MSYSRTERVAIPDAIFGNYSIIVATDVFNSVYEHFDEDDNARASVIIIMLLFLFYDMTFCHYSLHSVLFFLLHRIL